MVSSLLVCLLPPFFSVSLSLQQFLLQIQKISSRTRRGEAALLLGAHAPSLGCGGKAAMVSTPPYVREIRATHLFSCNYIGVGELQSDIPPAPRFKEV